MDYPFGNTPSLPEHFPFQKKKKKSPAMLQILLYRMDSTCAVHEQTKRKKKARAVFTRYPMLSKQ
jgi:hypothetical protein